jgi:hypothetical protein
LFSLGGVDVCGTPLKIGPFRALFSFTCQNTY